jgi:hypothetical protein
MTWDAILTEYRNEHQRDEFERFSSRRGMPSLKDAIRTAALSEDECGELHGHQQRHFGGEKRKEMLRKAADALVNAEQLIRTRRDFDTLSEAVESVLRATFGPNSNKELYAYDVAFRIGAWRGILPERVYLHRGTREGAEELLGETTKGRWTVEVSELPAELHSLEPWELEDILCIYCGRFPTRRP